MFLATEVADSLKYYIRQSKSILSFVDEKDVLIPSAYILSTSASHYENIG